MVTGLSWALMWKPFRPMRKEAEAGLLVVVPFLPPPPMALRRAIGSLVVRSQAYYLRLASPSPPPSFSRPIIPCRSFAAPPQHVKKVTKDDADDASPRINNDIIAPFLRLVADEGHSVVPRHEALQIAARMGLDLVEVHRKTDPPVYKIMDFHKEKYNKDVKEKERLKTKSAIVLRGGDNKEVRFKAKTEIKDLKVKADAITRLMEHGYRVKCMTMSAGTEAEDLGGPLSRLLGLIQDVCIVESGPHLDSKHAYVIVRHVKFATKKGGKKASKAMEDVGKGTPRNTASESPAAATNSRDETSEHGLEFEDVDRTPAYLSRESLAQKERINPGQGGSQSSKRGLGSRSENSHMEKREKANDQDMPPEQANSEDVADDNSNSVAAFDSSPMELRVFWEVFSRLLAQAKAAGRHFMVATTSSYISSLQWGGH
ncbi:hypothetical protein D1007_14714 [Hordeum vulgare]|nr:hypothetical protein D1007_14714 [Hordeum vulgare]